MRSLLNSFFNYTKLVPPGRVNNCTAYLHYTIGMYYYEACKGNNSSLYVTELKIDYHISLRWVSVKDLKYHKMFECLTLAVLVF